jgi:hypothetical protein
MTIQSVLQELKDVCDSPSLRADFLIIFACVVVGPLLVFVIGGRNANLTAQPGLVWFFLAIAPLLIVGIGGGFMMFRREAHPPGDISLIPTNLYQRRRSS